MLKNVMKKIIHNHFSSLVELLQNSQEILENQIETFSKECIKAINNKNKIIIFGNGGSASDAQHFAAELIGKYSLIRDPIPAICLNSDDSVITCIANDFGYSSVFSRQVDAIALDGDVVIGLTTSGKSSNIIDGIKSAKMKNCYTISLTGINIEKLKNLSNLTISVPSENTARIQEIHGLIIHIVCNIIELNLFSNRGK